ncbi:aldolase [Bordetella bronchiseptica]|uniref:aldolase n=1 Tax=Bordetella bronchiseptica TaxID=518 RepID=UPI000461C0D6|nr:aldolase [Bordetella bronchiseptica]KDB66638.1 class II aldolase/adducin N-terminal domain protein [Bordetella bronchiseptica B20-10725633]KDB70131.1 class II aldolase/adducin N-terminal domain protein [Bordetella bronchiseptica A1-7]KDC56163.1 class II aldolase/adducin N-terminal domain protein [Bordetella bronchiseptica MBORD595]KDD26437.1 class II aldolase/adducin N-terminal domain protein [Bordetella bronchiseptica MBORD782]KDD85096.1 class II aldolase/adducin N-terminal domain protein 
MESMMSSSYTVQDKDVLRARVDREIESRVSEPQWTRAQKMALACRMLAEQGHWHGGLAGQITARGDEPGTYWTLPFGVGADEARASELILIDEDLNPLDGESLPNPANRFHIWIYRHRPNVQCIVHTHPPAVSALSMVGEPLVVAHMDATPFYNDCAYLPQWPGLPIGDNEGEVISAALGEKRAILLANHGLLTAGSSIEESAVMALWMEQAAMLQLRARAIGPVKAVPGELAQESHDFLVKPKIQSLTFAYFARRVLRAAPDCLD